MKQIHVTMTNTNNKTILRELDISNFSVYGGALCNTIIQEEILNEWFYLHGNEQHNTKLTLVDWVIR